MTSAKHALHLLPRLSDSAPAVLAEVLQARAIAVDPGWSAIELAAAMATPAAIAHHLEGLPRHTLEALSACREGTSGAVAKEALDTLLVQVSTSGATLLPGVAEVWDTLEAQRQAAEAALPALAQTPSPDDLADLVRLAEFLEILETIVESAGIESTPPRKATAAAEPAQSPALARFPSHAVSAALELAERVGFTSTRSGQIRVKPVGTQWRTGDLAHRWQVILERWWAQCPSWWRTGLLALENDGAPQGVWQQILGHYPLLSPENLQRVTDDATTLGVLVGNGPSDVGRALVRGSGLAQSIERALPPPSGQLYPDGPDTVVAAGRLDPQLERALRAAGRWHSGCLTPRFHLSPHSVVAAGSGGAEALQRLRRALPEATASGLLLNIADAIERADSLRLRQSGGRVELTSDRPEIVEVIAADYNLRWLNWKRDGAGLVSAAPAHTVHERLLAEGYWHRVEPSSGHTPWESESDHRPEGDFTPRWDAHSARELQQRLNSADARGASCEAALALAIANKVSLEITVEVDGEPRVVSVEPSGLSNGRLRGLDSRAEVERTIPLAQIVSLTPSTS